MARVLEILSFELHRTGFEHFGGYSFFHVPFNLAEGNVVAGVAWLLLAKAALVASIFFFCSRHRTLRHYPGHKM